MQIIKKVIDLTTATRDTGLIKLGTSYSLPTQTFVQCSVVAVEEGTIPTVSIEGFISSAETTEDLKVSIGTIELTPTNVADAFVINTVYDSISFVLTTASVDGFVRINGRVLEGK